MFHGVCGVLSGMTTHHGTLNVQSQARGPHWIAWVVGPDGKPLRSIVLVARTRDEAEARAHRWGEKQIP